MKKKLLGGIAKTLIIAIAVASMLTANSQVQAVGLGEIIGAGQSFINQGSGGASVDEFVDDFIVIGQILVSIATGAVLIVTAIMAIKWITATPDKQAKLKTQLIGLLISIAVIFGAVGIWNLARNILSGI